MYCLHLEGKSNQDEANSRTLLSGFFSKILSTLPICPKTEGKKDIYPNAYV
jgi:hypothetical protein